MSSYLPIVSTKRFNSEDIPDLTGRVVLVTGGSVGIGYTSATALALANAHVIIASSTEDHGNDALESIRKEIKEKNPAGTGTVEFERVDLGSIRETRALADKIKQKDRLDIFIGNAAVGIAPFGLTKDGLENHFQVRMFHLLHLPSSPDYDLIPKSASSGQQPVTFHPRQ